MVAHNIVYIGKSSASMHSMLVLLPWAVIIA